MKFNLNIQTIIITITFLCNLFLAMYVISRDVYNRLYRSYFLFALTFVFWNLEILVMQTVKDHDTALNLIKFFAIGPKFAPTALFYFICLLTDRYGYFNKILVKTSLFFSIVFTILSCFNGLIIKDIATLQDGSYFIVSGNITMMYLLITHFLALPIYGVSLLFKAKKESVSVIDKCKYSVAIVGLLIVIVGASTDILFVMWNKNLYPIGSFTTFFYALSLAVAILKYNFMNIEVVFKKTFVYSSVFSLATSFFIIIIVGIDLFVKKYFGSISLIVTICTVGLLIYISQQLREKIHQILDRYFFKEKYNQKEVLDKFSGIINSEISKGKVLELIIHTINNVLSVEKVDIMLKGKVDEFYTIASSRIGTKTRYNYFKFDNLIVHYFNKHNPKFLSSLRLEKEDKNLTQNQEMLSELKKMDSTIIIPITLKEKYIGFVNLGNKLSGDIYDSQDIELVSNICNESAPVLEKSVYFGNLEQDFQDIVNSINNVITTDSVIEKKENDNQKEDIKKPDKFLYNIHSLDYKKITNKFLLSSLDEFNGAGYATVIEPLNTHRLPEEILNIVKCYKGIGDGNDFLNAKNISKEDISKFMQIMPVLNDEFYSNEILKKDLHNEGIEEILMHGHAGLFYSAILELFLDILEQGKADV